MTLAELMGPEARLPAPWGAVPILGLTADSRAVKPGFLFAALPGTHTDGSKFIADALARGAAAILVPRGGAPKRATTPVLEDADPRRRLALIASRFFAAQPETVVAVTGTNGKTSVASFVRQLWEGQGIPSASLGTIGVVSPKTTRKLNHTTPDPIELHAILAGLAKDGVTHLAFEASSHGLEQRRLDGVRLAAAAFTNITRDHLDYHESFENYFEVKLRLFRELLPPGAAAIVDVDSDGGRRVAEIAKSRGHKLVSVGEAGETLRLVSAKRDGFAQRLIILHNGKSYEVKVPLVGDFQATNALVAAGLVIATGGDPARVIKALANLRGAKGRLDLAGTTKSGAPIFVDYAHTPDALAKALAALRPYVKARLVVVFGCGGDRDKGKRPEMGAAAATNADSVIVTDDNPRTEEPAAVRRAILAAAPNAVEIADRATAINQAIQGLNAGDVLLIAGKGHETGQIVGDKIIPFSDHDAVAAALGEIRG
ncbi:MAG TPA: UDP-N-acetylmuramoyl-L-alanyl-D-glutamate--2,6-diaminopimelate ligase [Methyloceanibacter sp.]